ncbi:ATP binding protein [Sorangium cellulosum So ce56]|uniref:ATP binding protein n=1 Tax=Sorangium cellulosum (strain So ce56) TaxID=448385 RepID=A9GXM1_SORC5|nr:ATP-binding protein [Sorangium cellulosum]CAN97114.1 ATP binding protein [Sorangium cellulosum So ce56]
MAIRRNFDIRNLVRELAENKVSALEILREALSNAKDHGAERVWVKTAKDQRNEVTVTIADDGEGMDRERLEAFWGVGASAKPTSTQPIGYKGHGTKLFFDCRRLSVATRTSPSDPWCATTLDMPFERAEADIPEHALGPEDLLYQEIEEIGLQEATGTIILIEQVRFEDRAELLNRTRVESYCDWFTAVGDIRSGLYDRRVDFHRAIATHDPMLDDLRPQDSEIRPIEVRLRTNGEKAYYPIGLGPTNRDKEFLLAWKDDIDEFRSQPGLLAYGHRFADTYESTVGATRVRDDTSAIRLTSPANWTTEDGIAIVARVEGHRRQLQTYMEAMWSGHPGIYGFEQRFGLWLCRDFIPITQRNDLLRKALDRAASSRLRFEITNLRNWKVFINHQSFRLTANRNDVSNKASLEAKIEDALVAVLEQALRQATFREWVERLKSATLERRKDREIAQMAKRLDDVEQWIGLSSKKDGIDPMEVRGLPELSEDHSLLLKAPRSEQELFYVYGLISGRFEMPIHIIEYDATEGVDAIGKLREPRLLSDKKAHVRVEFKLDVSANNPIHHFFEAIDVIICWSVGRVGDIYEESSAGIGKLRKRAKSALVPPLDTHEIVHEVNGRERVIPILELSSLFPPTAGRRKRA